ncbi:MAG: OmpA family protein, partial [Desulfobacterales bacterium]|nr:OmpA family protein [Desulfobacterales bacterium]
IEKPDAKLINIFFVGQNEFKDILLKMENRALKQRITINYRLDPLTKNETEQYVLHRLKVAGSQKKIFTPKAIRKIFAFSGGYPRLINIICDHCLLTGYVKGKKTISGGIVKECAKELKITLHTVEKKAVKHIETTETKQEGRQEKQGKNKRKIVGYICLLVLLLLIAGYIRYSYGTKEMQVKPVQQVKPVKQIVKIQNNSVQKQQETQLPILPDQLPILPDQKLIIPFDYNSTELSGDIFEKLDLFASAMISNPDAGIVVKGYTGQLGDLLYNEKLSGLRANVVKNYLVAKGVRPDKIKTFGMGSATQIEAGDDSEKEGMPERRVEIEFDTNN